MTRAELCDQVKSLAVDDVDVVCRALAFTETLTDEQAARVEAVSGHTFGTAFVELVSLRGDVTFYVGGGSHLFIRHEPTGAMPLTVAELITGIAP